MSFIDAPTASNIFLSAGVASLWALYPLLVGIGLAQAITLYEPAFAVVARRYALWRRQRHSDDRARHCRAGDADARGLWRDQQRAGHPRSNRQGDRAAGGCAALGCRRLVRRCSGRCPGQLNTGRRWLFVCRSATDSKKRRNTVVDMTIIVRVGRPG